MIAALSAKSSALQIFQQQPASFALRAYKDDNQPVNLAAIANGVPDMQDRKPTKQAQSLITKALFDESQPNLTKVKLDLFARTGKALGVDKNKFATDGDFYQAVRKAFLTVKQDPKWPQIIDSLENELGLKDLGVSLETVINAMTDPNGKDDETLEAALKKKLEEDGRKKADDLKKLVVKPDEIGVYSLGAG